MEELIKQLEELKQNSETAISIQTSILLDAYDLYKEEALSAEELKYIAEDIVALEELSEMAEDQNNLHTLFKCCNMLSSIL